MMLKCDNACKVPNIVVPNQHYVSSMVNLQINKRAVHSTVEDSIESIKEYENSAREEVTA